MTHSALLLCLLLAAAPASSEPGAGLSTAAWRSKSSPHFQIYHESAWSPNSIGLELEKMFSAMRLTMSMFAPWMATEKSRIYIYSSQRSYAAGEFKPPAWSKGLAYPSKKMVVVYDTGEPDKLKAVLAHELSHLYFEGYYAEKLKYPPQWLNEGLAVYLEDLVFQGGGPWSRALPYFGPERRFAFGKLSSVKPEDLQPESRISDWYLQAFATVSYLYQPSRRLQFKNFCDSLRAGATEEEALWRTYRLSGAAELTAKTDAWLAGAGKGHSTGGLAANYTFKPVGMSSFPFTDFGAKK